MDAIVTPEDLSAREFLDKYGADEADRVCRAAGTNLPYFRQVAGGFRRPSVDLAEKLVAESGGRMGLLRLLQYKRPVAPEARAAE